MADDSARFFDKDDEEEKISEKFRAEEIAKFLETLNHNTQQDYDDMKKPGSFAQVAPDVVLERLIDEMDLLSEDGSKVRDEKMLGKNAEKLIEKIEDTDDDLNDTL